MGNRLSKIYTRTGDDGSTGLGDGTRVGKDSARVTAYGAMWAGGALLRRYQTANHGRTLALLVGSLLASVTVCHLLSQGSFYWLSPVVSEPTFAGWWKNFSDWYLPYLRVAAIYVGLAVIVHVMVGQVVRLARPRARAAG